MKSSAQILLRTASPSIGCFVRAGTRHFVRRLRLSRRVSYRRYTRFHLQCLTGEMQRVEADPEAPRSQPGGQRQLLKSLRGKGPLTARGVDEAATDGRAVGEDTPLLPMTTPKPKGGRERADDRAWREGILWIIRTGAR